MAPKREQPGNMDVGTRSALIVANARYDHPLSELRSPVTDARELAAVLRDPAVGNFDVELVVDGDIATVRRRIVEFFRGRGRDDLLLLHFSGHGLVVALLALAASGVGLAGSAKPIPVASTHPSPAASPSPSPSPTPDRSIPPAPTKNMSFYFAPGLPIPAPDPVLAAEHSPSPPTATKVGGAVTRWCFPGER